MGGRDDAPTRDAAELQIQCEASDQGHGERWHGREEDDAEVVAPTALGAEEFEARAQSPFISVEDLRARTKISLSLIDLLRECGCLSGLPETNQTTLFSF